MTSARWQVVTRIFDAALELPEPERIPFVTKACAGDAELESEVLRLLKADADAGSFLERPVLANCDGTNSPLREPSLLHPGTIVSQRFEIMRFIGQGGMGQVYEAFDHELKAKVALKTIRPEISSVPQMVGRFRREVHLTRLITHPNVCRTFDIEHYSSTAGGIPRDIVFLTMEFLDGETLAAFLRREGPLPTVRALPMVLQMAEALGAAHAVGIVHRDFKPSNVLLVPTQRGLRVVVTDFGLARPVIAAADPAKTSLTGSRGLLGTPVYMAPEQFERGEVSIATDIYSLGLVMFEMVTGQRPFADDLPFAEATKRLKQPAPSGKELIPNLDPAWDATVSHCLALNPRDRFDTVRQVTDALTPPAIASVDGALSNRTAASSRANRTHADNVTTHRTSPRKILAAGTICALFVSLSALAFRHYSMKAEEAKLAEGSTVFLTDIHNATGDGRFDNTTELVRNQLLQSPYFGLLDSDAVRNTLGQMLRPPDAALDPQTAREVAMRNGVRRVVFGAVSRVGDNYVLDLDVEQPDNSPLRFRQHWENHWTWTLSDWPDTQISNRRRDKDIPSGFLDAVRNSSDWIRHEIGESANDVARIDAPPEDVTTSNWDALSEFAQAEKFRANRDNEAAITALQNAVAADPNFALACTRLGDILVSLSRFTEAYVAYDKAIALGQQRLTRRERDRIQGIYANDAWDYARAEQIFRDYTTYYPHDYLGWFYRGTPLVMLGRPQEAIESWRKAADIDPAKMFAPEEIARFDLILRNFDDATKWTQHLRDHGHSEGADLVEGESDFLQGRFQQSQDRFTRLTRARDQTYRSYGYSLLIRLFAEQGRYAEAFDTITKGLNEDTATGNAADRADKILDRAYLNCRRTQYKKCLQDTAIALRFDGSLQRSMNAATLLGQAASEVSGGVKIQITAQLQRVEKQLPRSNLKPLSDIARARVHGEVLLAEGHWEPALEEFRKADSLTPPMLGKEYLARALVIAADHTHDEVSARRRREEALNAYAFIALKPESAWQWPADFSPGRVSDETLSYAKLAVLLGREGDARRVLRTYVSRRISPDPDSMQDREAADLLRSIH